MGRRSVAVVAGVLALGTVWEARASDAAPAGTDKNCGDFTSQRQAQKYFVRRGGPDRDPDGLDSDGNGVACESLPCPCSKASGPGSPGAGSVQTIPARTSKVFSGSTLRVRAFGARRSFYTVRLLGVKAPRPGAAHRRDACGARESTASLARLAFSHLRDSDGDGYFDGGGRRERRVTLVTDASRPTFDRAGRLLAYVRSRAGRDFGAAQLSRGWAVLASVSDLRQERRYRRLAAGARRHTRGLWGACPHGSHRRE